MFKQTSRLSVITSLLIVPFFSLADSPVKELDYYVDLSLAQSSLILPPMETGTYQIPFINAVPSATYQLDVTYEKNKVGAPPSVLKPVPGPSKPTEAEALKDKTPWGDYIAALESFLATKGACADVKNISDKIQVAKTSVEVKGLIGELNKSITEYEAGGTYTSWSEYVSVKSSYDAAAGDVAKKTVITSAVKALSTKTPDKNYHTSICDAFVSYAQQTIDSTKMLVNVRVIDGYYTEVALTSITGDESSNRQWKVKIDSEQSGKIYSSLSYLFALGINENYYYTEKIEGLTDATKEHHVVYKGKNNTDGVQVPAVVVTYVPEWADWKSIDFGFSAGVAVDQSNPGLLMGFSAVFGESIILTVGGGLFGDKELSGKYKAYEKFGSVNITETSNGVTTIANNIATLPASNDEAGLLRDVYSTSAFISLGFTFDL